jgi:hypothetical protein
MSYTANFPGSATFSGTTTSTTIPEFNTSLGTLTGVSFNGNIQTLSASADVVATIGSGTEPILFTTTVGLSSSATGLGNDFVSSAADALAASVDVSSNVTPVDADSTNLALSFSGSPSLTAVEGTGNLPLTLSLEQDSIITIGFTPFSTVGSPPTGSASGDSVTVNYTYTPTPVPEPASLGILGVGAAALLGRRRRIVR